MRLWPYSGAQSSSYSSSSSSSSYSVSSLLTKPCTFELRMLYYNTLLNKNFLKVRNDSDEVDEMRKNIEYEEENDCDESEHHENDG